MLKFICCCLVVKCLLINFSFLSLYYIQLTPSEPSLDVHCVCSLLKSLLKFLIPVQVVFTILHHQFIDTDRS